VQPFSQSEFPPISQTPSALQQAPDSQQTSLQQNWAPMGPHGVPSNWTVQEMLLTNGLQVSQSFAGLIVPSGTVVPAIVQVSPPHVPQFVSSAQQTSPGQHVAKQHSRPQQRPSLCSHRVDSDGADQSVTLTVGSQTSQSFSGLTSPGAKGWPSIRQPHGPHTPPAQHSPCEQQWPTQQTRPNWSAQGDSSTAGDQSVVLTSGSQTSQPLAGLLTPASTVWPSMMQRHFRQVPISVQHSPTPQHFPAQQTW
jgi:hypothetical protein